MDGREFLDGTASMSGVRLLLSHPGEVLVVVGDLRGIAEDRFRGVVALRREWAEESRGGIPMTCGIGSTSARNGGKSVIQVGFARCAC